MNRSTQDICINMYIYMFLNTTLHIYDTRCVFFFWILDFYVRLPGREMTIFTQKPDDNANLSEPI